MTSLEATIVTKALQARTTDDAIRVQSLIERAIGRRYLRPIGDRWNNQGILTASGSSYDHKTLELVTNMHDAVIERLALKKFGSPEAVPYRNPHEAAFDLLKGMAKKEQAALATVDIGSSGSGASRKHITLMLRDRGIGMTCHSVPKSIFQVGAGNKNGLDWLQGTFGLGGATTYRNAEAVILVTRRDPELLEAGEPDVITVAVVQWEQQHTTVNAFYLVSKPWRTAGDDALPLCVPATKYPDFAPGTYLSLISYGTEGLARRSGDERSFDSVFNTRLYRPVIPVNYRNLSVRDRIETLDGLQRRLDANPGPPGTEGQEVLPFSYEGETYRLGVRFRLFAKRGEPGERRNFVAYGHALVITSNGQVHAHWDPQEFKLRTKLNKLYDRILVVVESDPLPIEVRTRLFTADRSQLVRTDASIRLEKEIAAFLDDWSLLKDANDALIREAISGDRSDRPTLDIARKIARAFKAKGFSLDGKGGRGGGTKPPDPTPQEELYDDPTHFEGPDHVQAVAGKAKGIYFKLNAKDDFLGPGRRGQLNVTCDHPDIGSAELTVGDLNSGRVRVSIAIPETAEIGTYRLEGTIPEWMKTSGGLGPSFEWTTKLEVVSELVRKPTGTGSGNKTGSAGGASAGNLVALVWRDQNHKVDWDAATVGEIEMVPGKTLAQERPEYSDLANVNDEVPTIILNTSYSPLKGYVQARAAELTDEGKEQAQERYAVGVGVGLLILNEHEVKEKKAGRLVHGPAIEVAKRAAARAVLSILPEYDRLARELED